MTDTDVMARPSTHSPEVTGSAQFRAYERTDTGARVPGGRDDVDGEHTRVPTGETPRK